MNNPEYIKSDLEYQSRGAGGTRSTPVTLHRLQHLKVCLIQNSRQSLEICRHVIGLFAHKPTYQQTLQWSANLSLSVIVILIKQAGAELCQAQVKLHVVVEVVVEFGVEVEAHHY